MLVLKQCARYPIYLSNQFSSKKYLFGFCRRLQLRNKMHKVLSRMLTQMAPNQGLKRRMIPVVVSVTMKRLAQRTPPSHASSYGTPVSISRVYTSSMHVSDTICVFSAMTLAKACKWRGGWTVCVCVYVGEVVVCLVLPSILPTVQLQLVCYCLTSSDVCVCVEHISPSAK